MSSEAIRDRVCALVEPLRLVADHEGSAYVLHPRRRLDGEEFLEVVPLRSRAGKLLLVELYMQAHSCVPSAQGLAEGLLALEARARGAEQDIGLRVMVYADGVALDLGDDIWTRVHVTSLGRQFVRVGSPDAPLHGPLFRRGEGALALPRPVPGGDWQALRPFVNVASDDDYLLLLVWLSFALRPGGPYVILVLQGEQGSSKSTVAKVLVMLVDPGLAPLLSPPKDSQHLMVIAKARHVLAFDNLTRIDDDFKDGLCRLATGAGHLARRLYTDGDAVCWQACRPIILTGIDNLLVADDLTDRAIVLALPPILEGARRAEADFWADFERRRGLLLGVLLDAVSTGLRDMGKIRLPGIPRMADFAHWGAAVAPCFGAAPEDFLRAYRVNRQGAVESGLEGSPLAQAVRAFMEGRPTWAGTYGQLLVALDEAADEEIKAAPSWPRSPRGLHGSLRRLAPGLRAVGMHVEETGRTKAGSRIVLTMGDRGDDGDGRTPSHLYTLPPRSDRERPSPSSPEGEIVTG